jgi:hypothetical protein
MNSYNIFKFLGQADSALRRSLGVTRQQRALLRDSDSLKNRFGCANRLDSLSRPCDTICVQDKSSSMKGTDCRPSRIEASKRTTQQYIRRKAELSPQDQIAIVSFTVYAEIVLGLTQIGETDAITRALKNLQAGGGTDINEGLKASGRILCEDRSGDLQSTRLKRLLLLTDGHGGHPIRTAKKLKNSGVLIEVIGIEGDPSAVNEKLLRKVATTDADGTHYWFFRDTDSLVAHYDNLATGIVFRDHDK